MWKNTALSFLHNNLAMFLNLSSLELPKLEKFLHSTDNLIPVVLAIFAIAVFKPECPVPLVVLPAQLAIVVSSMLVMPNFLIA